MEAVIYLDTHVPLWLAGAPQELSPTAVEAINGAQLLLLSPMAELEIEYLYEVGRIQQPASVVIAHLRASLNLRVCDLAFGAVATAACQMKWTRDPFDRLITAQAAAANKSLLTRDKIIRANYPDTIW